jgi:hypothetical protein
VLVPASVFSFRLMLRECSDGTYEIHCTVKPAIFLTYEKEEINEF